VALGERQVKPELVRTLQQYFGMLAEAEKRQRKLEKDRGRLDERVYENARTNVEKDLQTWRSTVEGTLEELFWYPPVHRTSREDLKDFDFDRSVFIMTKFPDGKDGAKDAELTLVIAAVEAAIRSCQLDGKPFVPIRAVRRREEWLWANVVHHMLACRRGVAILEDKVLPELNPNVAMEWGFMRALNRDVLYLAEKSFEKERADWKGLISETFDWNTPHADIEKAIKQWLNGVGAG
jgi:hypothetical protein